MPATKHVSIRLTPTGFERLQAIAKARGVSQSRCIRQLIDEASTDEPVKPRRELSEAELLDLLRERASDGNVSAITKLLEIERQRDPRAAAMDALERMANGRRHE